MPRLQQQSESARRIEPGECACPQPFSVVPGRHGWGALLTGCDPHTAHRRALVPSGTLVLRPRSAWRDAERPDLSRTGWRTALWDHGSCLCSDAPSQLDRIDLHAAVGWVDVHCAEHRTWVRTVVRGQLATLIALTRRDSDGRMPANAPAASRTMMRLVGESADAFGDRLEDQWLERELRADRVEIASAIAAAGSVEPSMLQARFRAVPEK